MRFFPDPQPPLRRRPEPERPRVPAPEPPQPRRKEASAGEEEPQRGVIVIPIMEPDEEQS
jgi:hypothetical protein